jgi:hypothetical protein
MRRGEGGSGELRFWLPCSGVEVLCCAGYVASLSGVGVALRGVRACVCVLSCLGGARPAGAAVRTAGSSVLGVAKFRGDGPEARRFLPQTAETGFSCRRLGPGGALGGRRWRGLAKSLRRQHAAVDLALVSSWSLWLLYGRMGVSGSQIWIRFWLCGLGVIRAVGGIDGGRRGLCGEIRPVYNSGGLTVVQNGG